MHLIEFTGLPGSGKTTIRKELVARLRPSPPPCFLAEEAFLQVARMEGDLICRIILRTLPAVLAQGAADKFINRTTMQYHAQNRFLARYGQALSTFFGSGACQNMDEVERAGVIESFLQTGSLSTLMRDFIPSKGAIFFEEGLVQKSLMFVSLRGNVVEDHLVQTYLREIPLPSILIHVQADGDTCRQRMEARTQGPTKRLRRASADEFRLFLDNITAHLAKVIDGLHQRPEVKILEADSRYPIDEIVTRLAGEIRPLLLSSLA